MELQVATMVASGHMLRQCLVGRVVRADVVEMFLGICMVDFDDGASCGNCEEVALLRLRVREGERFI